MGGSYTAVVDKLGSEKERPPRVPSCTEAGESRWRSMATEGAKKVFKWFDQALAKEFEIKTDVLGPDEGEDKELRIFNRVIR